jgi:hypothetical protein
VPLFFLHCSGWKSEGLSVWQLGDFAQGGNIWNLGPEIVIGNDPFSLSAGAAIFFLFKFLNFKMIPVIYLVWLQGCTAIGEK